MTTTQTLPAPGTRVEIHCEWFAMCDRPADGMVFHPILGDVPTCQRCATKLGLDLVLGDWEVEAR